MGHIIFCRETPVNSVEGTSRKIIFTLPLSDERVILLEDVTLICMLVVHYFFTTLLAGTLTQVWDFITWPLNHGC